MHTLHFRRLGFRSRREAYVIREKNQLRRAVRAILNERHVRPEALAPDIDKETVHGLMCSKNPGMAADCEGSSINYVLTPGKWQHHDTPVEGTIRHEELHLLFGQVAGRYGDAARRRLVANLLCSVPSYLVPSLKKFIRYVSAYYKSLMNPMRDTHEEILTNLFHYLNDRDERRRFVRDLKLKDKPGEAAELHRDLRDIGRAIQAAAEVATPNWCFVYQPWELRAEAPEGFQLSFDDGPGKRVGRWAGKNRWRAVRPIMMNTAWDDHAMLRNSWYVVEAAGPDGVALQRDIIPIGVPYSKPVEVQVHG